jgi:tRNA-2-methylthio-N6-dimethylallyladenosine synthase
MEDTVPQTEKMRRLHAVEALQERIGSEINARLVGAVQEVLVEGEKEGPDGQAVQTGRNRGNKLVHARGEEGRGKKEGGRRASPGDLVEVRIVKATAWSLQGEIAAAVTAWA